MFKPDKILSLLLMIGCALPAMAGLLGDAGDDKLADLYSIRADKWTIQDRNFIWEGNVSVPYGSYHLLADRVVVNIDSRDIETAGNVRIINRTVERLTVSPEQLAAMQKLPDTVVEIESTVRDPERGTALSVIAYQIGEELKADTLSGNLITGYFEFSNASFKSDKLYFNAKNGVRLASGDFKIEDAEISTCEYLADGNSHYSLSVSSADIYSHQNDSLGLKGYNFSHREHSVLARNALVKLYGMPVFYLPYVYRPKDQSPHLFRARYGHDGDWGSFVLLSRTIPVADYPDTTVTLLGDYYSKRGWGYGLSADMNTESSRSNLFMYGISDRSPYRTTESQRERLDIPHYRYDIAFSNVTHITPHLDVRGRIEFMSDAYIQHDFFNYNYNNNPEPSTFVALESQFENFSSSLYVRARTNDFFTTVQRLPEYRIDLPRQELFGGLYYQGSHDISYLKMNWRDFDEPRNVFNYVEPADYSAMRLDTVNFLYYPIKLDWLNLVPRAGFRYTYYSESSETPITGRDLAAMFVADMPSGLFPSEVVNYDKKGGERNRFIGEVGLEASTKIYRTYNDVRSAFFGLDGLRHIIVPYLNYTYITKPSTEREHLYYFDDVDRIDEQNFLRFGLQNRLQTREGNQLVDMFTMENYWDLFMEKEDGYNRIGDFCTQLSMRPMSRVTLSTLFSINAGNNYKDRPGTIRDGVEIDRKGISSAWINRWNINLRYEPVDDFIFNLGYLYTDSYQTRSVYSMGSTLDLIEAGSYFDRYYYGRIQQLTFGAGIPLSPDRRTRIAYQLLYDFEQGCLRTQLVSLTHRMHCWEVGLLYSRDTDDNGRSYDNTFGVSVALSNLDSPLHRTIGEMPGIYRDFSRSQTALSGF